MVNPQVDDHINGTAPFAQPILRHLRTVFHRACPEVAESLKWGRMFFTCRGKMLAAAGAFQSHVRFRFWMGEDLPDPDGIFTDAAGKRMPALKLRWIADLPAEEVLAAAINEAVRFLEAPGKTTAPPLRSPKPALTPPPEFLSALHDQPVAGKNFETLSPSRRREYVEWVLEAKREATRAKRIATALEWLAEGKSLHWKYQRV